MLLLSNALQALAAVKDRVTEREEGGVVIEYGVVVATISLLLIGAGAVLVEAVGDWFANIGTFVSGLTPGP